MVINIWSIIIYNYYLGFYLCIVFYLINIFASINKFQYLPLFLRYFHDILYLFRPCFCLPLPIHTCVFLVSFGIIKHLLDPGTGKIKLYSPTSIKFPSGDNLGEYDTHGWIHCHISLTSVQKMYNITIKPYIIKYNIPIKHYIIQLLTFSEVYSWLCVPGQWLIDRGQRSRLINHWQCN
jgi:hypothetical protein